MGSGDENGIRASICEYHQQTEHSYASPFPRVDERDRTRRLGTMLHSYLRQLRLLRDSNPGHIGWRGGLSPLRYSYANLSTLSGLSTSSLTGDQRNRASVKSSPATRMDKLRTESLHGRRLKEKEELRWALAKTREGKCGTHIFFFPFGWCFFLREAISRTLSPGLLLWPGEKKRLLVV